MRALLILIGAVSTSVFAQEPGDVIQDCDDCPRMVVVPAGSFVMGTAKGAYEVNVESGEGPPIRITIDQPYAIGETEVTIGHYRAFVEASGYDVGAGCHVILPGGGGTDDAEASWEKPVQPKRAQDHHPVACLSYAEMTAYADWLTETTEHRYRLPSESEWEFAARAGTTGPRPWGANNSFEGVSLSLTCEHANGYDGESQKDYTFTWPYARCNDGFADVALVASFQASAYGLYDMMGNLWERTEDCYTASYWGRPPDQRAWVWEGGCERRIVRGGGWYSRPTNIRPARRASGDPNMRGNDLGFRLVREMK
ncbi:MAG: SUMF1/EgtB/PvdO family nonheme iron enzyme [Rhodospirillaceae bacterium]|jgi:formylglycine-generating enzyme|nr:SUMF1/EgtB/PvdO family nonheme iron enzyme [Rhodospirillaceae bacterium]